MPDQETSKKAKPPFLTDSDDMQITTETTPPPGYTFLPIVGNSDLTALCKDLSREQDAMIFMVSVSLLSSQGYEER